MLVHTEIVKQPIEISKWLDRAKHPHAGAIVYFGGITRDSFEGKHVKSLAYDAYVPRAEKTLASIANEAAANQGVQSVVLIHRIGVVPLSEESVCIVVAASHRQQGWKTAQDILERVKQQAEIWKCEEYDDGSSQWVEGVQRTQNSILKLQR